LSVEFDYALHKLAVEELIIYTNNASAPLHEITLMIEPLYYQDAFQWRRFSWEDGTPIEKYDLHPGKVIIPLDETLQSGESLSIWIAYDLKMPRLLPEVAVRGLGPLGYTELQTNLTDWYPFIPPYLAEDGWLAHPPAYYGEHLVYEAADFEVAIHPVGTMQDIIIAASAPSSIEDGVYRYQAKSARNFTWSASPYYRVKSKEVDGITVSSYYFPEHWAAGQRVLTTTVEALDIYSQLFGPYPHTSLSAVEADFIDGMEYDGLYFLGDHYYTLHNRKTADFLVAVAAHETAHQWWYGLVGNDQALEPWLDEALCTYSESLFYEHLHPDDLSWWWTYRVHYYQPAGAIDISIYDVPGRHHYRDYRDPVYLNGAVFIDQLRETIGDDAFYTFIEAYLSSYQHAIVSQADFFEVLRQFTDKDLTTLISQFFTGTHSDGSS
jgi:hypothetical protein